MKAYVYSLQHSKTGKWYYGVRKSETDDLFIEYFTSSKLIRRLIKEEGTQAFTYRIRKRFDSYEEARTYETKFLKKVRVVTNQHFFNQAVSSPGVCIKDSVAESERRRNISNTMLKKWQDPLYAGNSKFNKLSKEERIRRGKLSVAAKAAKYASGELQYKERTKPSYKEKIITKNGVDKNVKANQVPAYEKYGWKLKGL